MMYQHWIRRVGDCLCFKTTALKKCLCKVCRNVYDYLYPFLSFILFGTFPWSIYPRVNKGKERGTHRGWVKIYQITLQEQPKIPTFRKYLVSLRNPWSKVPWRFYICLYIVLRQPIFIFGYSYCIYWSSLGLS